MTKEQEEAIELFKELEIRDDKEFVNARETILSILEEKDKQIDLMAEFIAQTEIDELICKNIEYCIADDEYSNCYKCIKQYFENKVKEK